MREEPGLLEPLDDLDTRYLTPSALVMLGSCPAMSWSPLTSLHGVRGLSFTADTEVRDDDTTELGSSHPSSVMERGVTVQRTVWVL